MNKTLLNTVKDAIIAHANANGIRLADSFKTADDFRRFVVALTVCTLMEARQMPINAAYDMAMGDGEYARLADAVWAQLTEAGR